MVRCFHITTLHTPTHTGHKATVTEQTLQYTTLHYTAIHYTTLHCTTLHYTYSHGYSDWADTALHCTGQARSVPFYRHSMSIGVLSENTAQFVYAHL